MKMSPFDRLETLRFNEAREDWLETFLPDLIKSQNISTALDAGCGFGFFSRYLRDLGLKVTAFDGRLENVEEARRRNPDVEFSVYDVEDPTVVSLGQFDLVLCFGLLYHLENPLRAIRNLASVTGKVLLVETVIAPTRSMVAFLYEEDPRQDQGLNYIALIPSEPWLEKSLYIAGFPFVYKTRMSPNHEYFRSSLVKKRMRTVLIASKVELSLAFLTETPPPKTNRYLWDSWIVRAVVGSARVRQIIRSLLGLKSPVLG